MLETILEKIENFGRGEILFHRNYIQFIDRSGCITYDTSDLSNEECIFIITSIRKTQKFDENIEVI